MSSLKQHMTEYDDAKSNYQGKSILNLDETSSQYKPARSKFYYLSEEREIKKREENKQKEQYKKEKRNQDYSYKYANVAYNSRYYIAIIL